MQTVMSVLCKFELFSSSPLLTKYFDHHDHDVPLSVMVLYLMMAFPVWVASQQPCSLSKPKSCKPSQIRPDSHCLTQTQPVVRGMLLENHQ